MKKIILGLLALSAVSFAENKVPQIQPSIPQLVPHQVVSGNDISFTGTGKVPQAIPSIPQKTPYQVVSGSDITFTGVGKVPQAIPSIPQEIPQINPPIQGVDKPVVTGLGPVPIKTDNTQSIKTLDEKITDNREHIGALITNVTDNRKVIENNEKNIAINAEKESMTDQKLGGLIKFTNEQAVKLGEDETYMYHTTETLNGVRDETQMNTEAIKDNSAGLVQLEENSKSIRKSQIDTKINSDNIDKISKVVQEEGTQIRSNQESAALNSNNIDDNSKRIDSNTNKIDSLQEESRKGIAGVSAIAGIKYQGMTTGQAQIGVGYGNYKSESSIALGTAVQASENLMINGAVSGTQGDNASPVYSAGASYKFNLFN